jgi:hypothetical protein
LMCSPTKSHSSPTQRRRFPLRRDFSTQATWMPINHNLPTSAKWLGQLGKLSLSPAMNKGRDGW